MPKKPGKIISQSNPDYKEEWGDKVAKEFERITGDFLSLLANYPQMGVVEVREKRLDHFNYQAD